MYRATIDTNVFISGGTISAGSPSQIINHWRNQVFVIVSPQLISEYGEVLQRPEIMHFTGLSTQENYEYIQEVNDRAYKTSGRLTLGVLADDPDDNIVLGGAEEGMATHLVTGNANIFRFKNIRVLK